MIYSGSIIFLRQEKYSLDLRLSKNLKTIVLGLIKGKALSPAYSRTENSFVCNYLSPNSVSSCPVGLRILAFRPLSGKLKNTSLSVLRGSAVKITNPFRVSFKPPVLRVVVDSRLLIIRGRSSPSYPADLSSPRRLSPFAVSDHSIGILG
jgi:hypothetical protein